MRLADSWLAWLAHGAKEVIYPGGGIYPGQAGFKKKMGTLDEEAFIVPWLDTLY